MVVHGRRRMRAGSGAAAAPSGGPSTGRGDGAAAPAAQVHMRNTSNKKNRSLAVFWLVQLLFLAPCLVAREVDMGSPTPRRLRVGRHRRHSAGVGADSVISTVGGGESKAAKGGSWVWERQRRDFYGPVERACKVFCEGDLLDAVQTAGIFEDSKEFVDMPLRFDPEYVLEKFNALSPAAKADKYELSKFVTAHFLPPGSELVPMEPTDFTETPSLLARLAPNSTYARWADALNLNFKQLTRKVSEDVFANPQRYSLLRRGAAVVIPGGRFRESYYWDSYWIVLGLLACDMRETARGLVQNLLDDVADFGFVPNGGRIYYLNRSQPPLLSEMLMALLEADPTLHKDAAFLSSALAALDAEYRFWMVDGEHAVKVTDERTGKAHVLNRFWTRTTYPRPESYKEDISSSLDAPLAVKRFGGIYANIAAGAESGWDFSSRWIVPGQNATYRLSDIETTNILPVDLNAYLYRMERNLARLHELQATAALPPTNWAPSAGTAAAAAASEQALAYAQAADRRALAMDALMWSETLGYWEDYVVVPPAAVGGEEQRAAPGAGVVSASNFLPLWCNLPASPVLEDGPRKALAAVAALKASGLVQVGGVQTTLQRTEEQWDAPNAWAPVQQMLIEGLELAGTPEAAAMALDLAKAWLQSNYLGWANTGQMHEKYNALVPGARGEGGEYRPQLGFGWSNGVVLHLLNVYGETLSPRVPAAPEAPAIQLKAEGTGALATARATERKGQDEREAGQGG